MTWGGGATADDFERCVAISASRGGKCGNTVVPFPSAWWTGRDLPLCGHHQTRLEDFVWKRMDAEYHELCQRINDAERTLQMLHRGYARTEIEREVPLPGKLARSHQLWRSNTFHLARTMTRTKVIEWDNEETMETSIGWWCGGGASEATFADTLPDDCELCQRCVEAMDFEQRRDIHRESIDRSAYHERTNAILSDIEKRTGS